MPVSFFILSQISMLLHSFCLDSVQPKLRESSLVQVYRCFFAGILTTNSTRLTTLFLLWIFCIKLDCYLTLYANKD